MIELENLIVKYVPKCPTYVPPIAVFDLDCSTNTPSISLMNTKKGKRGRKSGSGKGLVLMLYFCFYIEWQTREQPDSKEH